MNKINCLVQECSFNSNHDCEANAIEVGSSSASDVCSPDNTFCKTFMVKNQENNKSV